jgi:hypothetical protein
VDTDICDWLDLVDTDICDWLDLVDTDIRVRGKLFGRFRGQEL